MSLRTESKIYDSNHLKHPNLSLLMALTSILENKVDIKIIFEKLEEKYKKYKKNKKNIKKYFKIYFFKYRKIFLKYNKYFKMLKNICYRHLTNILL